MVLSAVFAKVSKSRYKLDAELPIDVKVDTTATITCFEPDAELPMDVEVDTTATTTRFEPDAELPSDTKVDTISTELRGSNDEFQTTHRDAIAKDSNTTHRDADQEGVETKLHALLSPRITGESTRWDCSKLNFLTQAPNKLFSPLDSASDAAFHIRINEEGLPYCPSKG